MFLKRTFTEKCLVLHSILVFFHCSKDRCRLLCKKYEIATVEEKKGLQANYDEHIARKIEANKSKAEDKQRATNDPTFCYSKF